MNQPLRDLWDQIDAGAPPLAEVSAEGERVKRRRRRQWTAAGAAAVVLAIVAGGFSVRLLTHDRANDGAPASSFPAPPQGMRWVGLGKAVVAVPEWWSTGETRCLAPVEDTVYFDPSATVDCVDIPPPAVVQEVSALAVLDATGGYGEYVMRSMRPIAEVDGREVLERQDCEEWFEGVCRRLFAVPAEGVVFAVTIADPGDGSYEEIRDSLRILPETLTTVPLAISDGWTPTWGAEPGVVDSLVDALESAGLRVEIKKAERPEEDSGLADYASLPTGSLLDVSPALGSVIDVGGTVTVTVAGSADGPDDVGARFLAFAQGEVDDLPVDTPVRLYLGNQYQKTISAEDAGDRSSWDICAAYAERSCPMSAVTTLQEFGHQPALTDFLPDGCLDTLADAPTDTGGRMVVLGVPEPQTCADDFAVQIWSNDAGQITAVNLLFGSP